MQSLLIFLFRLLSENKKVLAEALSYFYGNFVSIVIKLRKYNQKLLISVTSVFLFAIFASVNFVLLIGKNKYLVKALLDGSDAARVLAFDHVDNLTIGLCGDLKFGRTVHSLIEALVRYPNVKFVLISPEELRIPSYIREDVLKKNGCLFIGKPPS